jgi:hypothetical protein
MVVAEGPTEYRLITQNDHADLAGQFASHWGNDKFAALLPWASMVFAAESHDNGWWHWDINPSVDDQGVPITFRKTPRKILFEYLSRGIDGVVEKDPYAGLMVSLHLAGLSQHRYGTLSAVPGREDEFTLKFVREQEESHKALKEKIGRMEQYAAAATDDYLWFNYRLMQVFDRLSLFFCCNFGFQDTPGSDSLTQKDRDSGRAYYGSAIKPTPVRFGSEDVELQLRLVDNTTLVVDPYPFDEAPLRVNVRGRIIPRRAYQSQEEFRDVYSRQPRESFNYSMTPK